MAQRSGRQDGEGFDILVVSLVIILATLALTALAGRFGRTPTISQAAEPVWTQASWQK